MKTEEEINAEIERRTDERQRVGELTEAGWTHQVMIIALKWVLEES